jgi:protein-S-isoprenylcysteine O-methyltransferase Ste14
MATSSSASRSSNGGSQAESSLSKKQTHPIVGALQQLVNFIMIDIPWLGTDKPGGVFRLCYSICLAKGLTALVVLAWMAACGNWSNAACTYLALHGSYGVVWTLKDFTFPDAKWQVPQTRGAFVGVFASLAMYWVGPFELIASHREVSSVRLGWAIALYAVGLTLMTASDAQKFYTLRERRGLITDGFFARTRNPNYLGEMMLYGAFAVVCDSWIAWIAPVSMWTLVFVPNMLAKDASMSRYKEWPAYIKQSSLLLPKVW